MLTALSGDKAAYRALLEALGQLLRRYFRRRLSSDAHVEDLVQETLIAIHTKRETYDTGLPFTPWVHAIARYKLLDHLRRNRTRATVPLEDASEFLGFDDSEAKTARRDLERLLGTLPKGSQDIIRKVKLDGYSTQEIAAASGRSEIAVRVGLHRALKLLTARLRERPRDADV